VTLACDNPGCTTQASNLARCSRYRDASYCSHACQVRKHLPELYDDDDPLRTVMLYQIFDPAPLHARFRRIVDRRSTGAMDTRQHALL
jgi:hypothetical protein